MEDREIVRASPGDAVALVALRDRVASWLQGRGIHQWLPGEFGVDRMHAWIDQGAVDACWVGGQIVAAVAVLWQDAIWPDDDRDAGYVHLLMVDRRWAGRGLGGVMLAHAEQRIRQAGGVRCRLDAVSSNAALQAWCGRRGYRAVGTVHFDREELFDTTLFEKPLPLLPAALDCHPAVESVEAFLQGVVVWADEQLDVQAVGLAGSWARGSAGPGSDVDLVVIVDDVERRLMDDSWVRRFEEVSTATREDWGAVQSLRVWYRSGIEVEYGLAASSWMRTPLDQGTARVIDDGFVVLHDPHGRLAAAVRGRDSM